MVDNGELGFQWIKLPTIRYNGRKNNVVHTLNSMKVGALFNSVIHGTMSQKAQCLTRTDSSAPYAGCRTVRNSNLHALLSFPALNWLLSRVLPHQLQTLSVEVHRSTLLHV